MNNEPRPSILYVLTALGTHADLLSRIYDECSIPASDIPDDARAEMEEYAMITCLDGECRLTPELRRMLNEGIEGMEEVGDAE
jgi:hypothetical protein